MPAATRIGDADITDCTGMVRAVGSPNVFVDGIAWSRQGDINTTHLRFNFPPKPKCVPHAIAIQVGSTSVFVNSKGAGRIGDATCTAVAEGSTTVFAGG